MKIKCDVCDKEEATLFCSADEAALCDACDRRVHHANKLASKHHRFSLVNPSSKDSARCDICQERRALLFCKEDRALLCRECDIPIHQANVHTQNHDRFLLTGTKVSPNYFSSSSSQQTSSSSSVSIAASKGKYEIKTSSSRCNETVTPSYSTLNNNTTSESTSYPSVCTVIQEGSFSTSNISEYLMETLPGWHVEDFLDPQSCSPHGFCKIGDQTVDAETESNVGDFSFQDFAVWELNFQNRTANGVKVTTESNDVKKVRRKRNRDDIKVPRIS